MILSLNTIISVCQIGPNKETWTLTETELDSKSLKCGSYQRMLAVTWTERVTSIEPLQKMKKNKKVLMTVKIRNL